MTTSTTSSGHNPRLARVLSWLVGIVGLVMLIVGIAVYGYTSSSLASQDITVSAVTAEDPGALAGKPVAGPFTALAQANAIKHHVGENTYGAIKSVATDDGQTYNKDLTADQATDGKAHSKGDTLSAADAEQYAAKQTAQTGSFLQASLLVSVVAFGVAALIAGLGLLFIILAIILLTSIAAKGSPRVARE